MRARAVGARALLFVCSTAVGAQAQATIDPSLAAYIAAIRAVDNHAHVNSVVPVDSQYDALPLDTYALILTLVFTPHVPKDPCALLKAAEIQTLDPKGQIGTGVPSKPDALGALSCEYEWGPGGNAYSGKHYLHVTVGEASKLFVGLDAATLKLGIAMQAKSEPNGAAISGVGDAAVFSSTDKIRSKTMALVKGLILQVNYEALDGFAQKDHVIALLKAAAARL